MRYFLFNYSQVCGFGSAQRSIIIEYDGFPSTAHVKKTIAVKKISNDFADITGWTEFDSVEDYRSFVEDCSEPELGKDEMKRLLKAKHGI